MTAPAGNRPFILKPPTHTVGEDTSMEVTSTAPRDPEPLARRILDLSQPKVAAPVVPAPALAPAEPEPEFDEGAALRDAASVAEAVSEAAKAMVPESGVNRDSFFSRFMGSFAQNSGNAVDTKLLTAVNEWLRRVVVTHTTAETSLRDFGHAMTEHGVPIDANLPRLEKFVQELIWIRNMRELIETLTLADYTDAIVAREIDKEFGSAHEVEGEIAKTKSRKLDLENFLVGALTSMSKSIADLRASQAMQKPAAPSPFRPTPGARRPGAASVPPAPPAPVPPVAPPVA